MRHRPALIIVVFFTCLAPLCATGNNEASFTNSVGMKLVLIKPGSFLMGQTGHGDWDEMPVHRVNITRPFYMAATEVTNAQYEQFDPNHRVFRGRYGLAAQDHEAVIFVTWHDAVAFCRWLSKTEQRPYHLPTEAQWQYACSAGTTTAYNTGSTLPDVYHKNQKQIWQPEPVDLSVAATPPNAWGLHDMHGNVEEWCYDWYGPYEPNEQNDPVGRADGDFKVTRGGSHSTEIAFLRSANRLGTLPQDKHWLIGFRVVMGELPQTEPPPKPEPPLWARNVTLDSYDWSQGPDPSKPYFHGPRNFVNIPPDSRGPLFSKHNHQPAITACPNGDLMAIWYSTNSEAGRELAVVASRLRAGSDQWETAAPFWDAPDRNDHGSAIWWNGRDTIYHFNGLSTDATWRKLALIMRTSTENGATWSRARLIGPTHGFRHQVIAGVSQTNNGRIVLPCDAATGGGGGTAVHISWDAGKTWFDPGAGRPKPDFGAGQSGAWIAGIHAGIVQLQNGNLLAFGRGDNINGHMPMSISTDMGKTWTYAASEFPPLAGGQRLALIRLSQGPIMLASFTDPSGQLENPRGMLFSDTAGQQHRGYGLFAALSFDEGKTWPIKKLVTPGGPPQICDGGAHTGKFTLDAGHGEPRGYLAATQAPDGAIHLISSSLHYTFNLAWLKQPPPSQQ